MLFEANKNGKTIKIVKKLLKTLAKHFFACYNKFAFKIRSYKVDAKPSTFVLEGEK